MERHKQSGPAKCRNGLETKLLELPDGVFPAEPLQSCFIASFEPVAMSQPRVLCVACDLIEREVAAVLSGAADEMALVDLDLLERHVTAGEHANLADLVDSAAEMFFVAGTLRYRQLARVQRRNRQKGVMLGLVLTSRVAIINVDLWIGRNDRAVRVTHFSPMIDGPVPPDELKRALLELRVIRQ